ncbi:hypothetical protein ACFL31_02505, partial [Candidatus Margulisiibacteriota bacterium]
AGIYTSAEVSGNSFIVNGFDLGTEVFAVGETFIIATDMVEVGWDYYGSETTITISGDGWDEADDVELAANYVSPGAVLEATPEVKVWFGNRLYQPKLVAKGETFVVSPQPTIRLDYSIQEPYTLAEDLDRYVIKLDPGTPQSEILSLETRHVGQKAYTAGTTAAQGMLENFSIEYDLSEPLLEGEHTFNFSARSSGSQGVARVGMVVATVEVMGGPGRLVGTPITFPSPFSITQHGTVNIQYQLSGDTNIQIILVDISGKRIRNWIIDAGQEGGSAGINKVAWNGQTDRGTLAGNGIYLGTIVARDEGRRLGSVKLTIVN